MLYLLLLFASVFAAIVPMVAFLGLVWWMDRYDREPIWLVALTFLWGACGATFLSLVGNTSAMLGLSWILGDSVASLATPVIVAPLIEEPTKAAVLFLVLMSRHFDNTTDGFVYGVAAGLGFGMTENFMYFSTAASAAGAEHLTGFMAWLMTVAARTFFSAVMHATATSCVGAALGWSRFRGWPARLLAVPVGFGAAMGMHALWNGLLTADAHLQMGGRLVAADFLAFPVEVVLVFTIFQLCLWDERSTIRRELSAEARNGTLPAAHVAALSSYLRRAWGQIADPGVDQHAYVRAATTLAFRRYQSRRVRGAKAVLYARDVERLRREVKGILAAGARVRS